MSKCPLCHAQVKDDFGLIECPGCGAQLIVHMDGRLEYQGAREAPQEVSQVVPPEKTGEGFRMPEDDMYDASVSSEEPPQADQPEKEFLGSDSEPEQGALPPEPYPDFDGQEASSQGAVYNSSDSSASPDMSDVARFGNSDISGGREGPLRYNLFIEGVDTVDIREAFREAITDRKLMWDTDQILRSLRNGQVNIQNIAPTKAYILITRLRGLPVQVRWEQYAISQT